MCINTTCSIVLVEHYHKHANNSAFSSVCDESEVTSPEPMLRVSVEKNIPTDSQATEIETNRPNSADVLSRTASRINQPDQDSGEDKENAKVTKENCDTPVQFNSPKEKECWDTYRKMSDKGIKISFDTLLRGMLTPTEYRLRRKQSLPTAFADNC